VGAVRRKAAANSPPSVGAGERSARRSRRAKAPRPAPSPVLLGGVALAGLGALLGLVGVLALRPIETLADPWDTQRLAIYGLLALGPAAIFWAAGQALRMGLFWLFGTVAWGVFGYVLIFVPPPTDSHLTAAAVGGFLLLFFFALIATLTPPLYALGRLLFTGRLHRQDLRRAIRQASLLALYAVACLGMVLFALFNGLTALLLFVVLALMEFFFLSNRA